MTPNKIGVSSGGYNPLETIARRSDRPGSSRK